MTEVGLPCAAVDRSIKDFTNMCECTGPLEPAYASLSCGQLLLRCVYRDSSPLILSPAHQSMTPKFKITEVTGRKRRKQGPLTRQIRVAPMWAPKQGSDIAQRRYIPVVPSCQMGCFIRRWPWPFPGVRIESPLNMDLRIWVVINLDARCRVPLQVPKLVGMKACGHRRPSYMQLPYL